MTRRIKLITIPGFLCILLVGCATLREQAEDPNSGMSKMVAAVNEVAPVVQAVAPAAGPYGWIIGGLTTAVTALIGAYKVVGKNEQLDIDKELMNRQQDQYNAVRATTRAIVEAVENLGTIKIPDSIASSRDGTLGGAVKMKVQEVLEKNKIDVIGKAIIDGLKASQKKPC